jgi:deazaflavin-dependent oxidoreductase (nitroreductase family)
MIIPEGFWKRIRKVQRIHQRLYDAGLDWVLGWIILLLGHTGRRSGKLHTTPLQYEKIKGAFYVGAARGTRADWYRNIRVNPQVRIRVGRLVMDCLAEPVVDIPRVIAFLKYRYEKHPFMMGWMMKIHKLPMRPDDSQLQELAKTLAIVILHPTEYDPN